MSEIFLRHQHALSDLRDRGIILPDGSLEPAAMLKRTEVEALTGRSRSSIYRDMSDGVFPRPKRIGRNGVAWPAADIDQWKNNLPSTEK